MLVGGGAVEAIQARIVAAATVAAMVASIETWGATDPPVPFASATVEAAASLRNVLNG